MIAAFPPLGWGSDRHLAADAMGDRGRRALDHRAELAEALVGHAHLWTRNRDGPQDLAMLVVDDGADAAQAFGALLVVDRPAALADLGKVGEQRLRIDDGARGEFRHAAAMQPLDRLVVAEGP